MIRQKLDKVIREVPDFPKPGILFKDITPIFLDQQLCSDIVDELAKQTKNLHLNAIIGIESRGFFFGILLANKLQIPFIPIRKKGKLPYKTVSYEYELEYGFAEVEMHQEVIQKGWNVLIHDDLLATGGTAAAAGELVVMQEANVAGFSFVVELKFLKGTEKLEKYTKNIINLISY